MNHKKDDIEYLDFDVYSEPDCSIVEQSLVYFFREENDVNSWCGTGVIVGRYLLTVAHVMMEQNGNEKVPIPFLFYKNKNDKDFIRLDSSNIMYDGRVGLYDDVENIHHDLIIFNVEVPSSLLKLNTQPFEIPYEVYSKTYNPTTTASCSWPNKILEKEGFRYEKAVFYYPWTNCFISTGCYEHGNSGLPLFRDNIIYGLLIGKTKHPNHGEKTLYNFIDARYIQQIIEKNK